MIECHYASPAREKIVQMQKAGTSDQAIVTSFVANDGNKVLAEPPNEGFNILAVATPFIALGIGLALVAWFIRRYRKPNAVPVMSDEEVRKYQDQIDKEFSKLD